MVDVHLKCRCGKVQGVAKEVSPHSGSRVVCYCDDCQAFARFLGREVDVLDEYGGTDIYQLTPAQVSITDGAEYLRSMRLRPKGLIRWYTGCCNTPIGNTVSAALPFVGMVHNFMDDKGARDKNLGAVRLYVHGKFAKGTPPVKKLYQGIPLSALPRIIFKMIFAKLRGKTRPNPFFDNEGHPVSEPVLTSSSP